MDLIRSGYEGGAKKRFDSYRATFVALGKALPPDVPELVADLIIERQLAKAETRARGGV